MKICSVDIALRECDTVTLYRVIYPPNIKGSWINIARQNGEQHVFSAYNTLEITVKDIREVENV